MRPLRARINLAGLDNNLKQAQRLASNQQTKLIAVIKANAYGHGISPVARHLSGKAEMFAVASIDEALELRQAGITDKILLLQGLFHLDECELVNQYNLTPVIHSQHQYDWLKQYKLPTQLWIKVETAMHRLGFDSLPLKLVSNTKPNALVLMHHYACADTPEHPLNAIQRDNFIRHTNKYAGAQTSCANSAVICGQTNSTATALPTGDFVRPGIMLYGANPLFETTQTAASLGLQPVMQLESQLIACKPVKAGDVIGYGATFSASTDGYIGVVACGYGDGYPREFLGIDKSQNVAYAKVNNKNYNLVGRVSMDMLTLWLGDSPQPVGSKVVLWGDDPSVEQLAKWARTIPYTLLCGITNRVEREYIAAS